MVAEAITDIAHVCALTMGFLAGASRRRVLATNTTDPVDVEDCYPREGDFALPCPERHERGCDVCDRHPTAKVKVVLVY